MKIFHLSDLHLGIRLNGYSLIEDQAYILDQILSFIDTEHPDAVIIAGDLYDRSVPSVEAVRLCDDFLTALSSRKLQILIISGNHDSPERLTFGRRLMQSHGVHIAPVFDGVIQPITLSDAYGTVSFYLLPFIKPAQVRQCFDDDTIKTYTDAMARIIAEMAIDPAKRNVLVTHQFVTGAQSSDYETIVVGGTDNIDAVVFEPFDYVALGHLHRPQHCGFEKLRYCGTPLKYSFSEVNDQKSVTIIELGDKGRLQLRTAPLTPLHEMVELKGTYAELTLRDFYAPTTWQEDYVHITLTDEEDIPNALGKLRTIYHRLMKLDYDNTRTRQSGTIDPEKAQTLRQSPVELFGAFYHLQNNRVMNEAQAEYLQQIIENIWEDAQ